MPLVPLSTLPTGTRFRHIDGTYIRLEPTGWDRLRDDPSHWLNGISPQVERRSDVIYVMDCERTPGVLVLMKPDAMVEPLPDAWEGQKYHVTIERPGSRDVYGSDTLSGVQWLIHAAGKTHNGLRVAVECEGQHINADGTPCKEQAKGLQFRACESRVMIGSIAL